MKIKKWVPGANVLATFKRQRINQSTGEVGEEVDGDLWRPPTEYRTDFNFSLTKDQNVDSPDLR